MQQMKAAAILVVWSCMFILGTPGLDELRQDELTTEAEIARVTEMVGPTVTGMAIVVADANRRVRLPVERRLRKVQRPFRISQAWSLYTGGASRVGRLEIHVDGELVYRSVDDEHRWLRPVLRHRRLRPVVETTVEQDHPKNWKGLVRLVTERARRDFPDATDVTLTATRAPYPDRKPAKVRAVYGASAPEWIPERRR